MLNERQVARLLDIANAACHKGMVGDARAILGGVLAVRPGFVPALISLAFSHVVVDDFATAISILDEVLRKRPHDADALSILGLAHMLAGERDAAGEAFARIPQGTVAAQMASVIMQEM